MYNPVLTCDKELLLQVARGDEHAFGELFNTYHQQLATHIFRITESVELAEEVVQDTFLKIWLNREALTSINSFKAYIWVLAKNHALNSLRKLAKERMIEKHLEDVSVSLEIPETADTNQYYALLDQAIDHLPPQQQKVYLLSKHDRLKYDEIANRMGISRETVKKYLQVATHSITHFLQANHNAAMLILTAALFF